MLNKNGTKIKTTLNSLIGSAKSYLNLGDEELETISPRWPFEREIFYHLDYRPYIDLKIKFDPKPLLEEAFRALPYFVVHRNYDQSSDQKESHWKSLSLQSVEGDYQKTSYHTEYGITSRDGVYKRTPFAELCPETMKLIQRITDSKECDRIRFMLLEPGAKIHPHRDMKNGEVGLAINISLNMPDQCEFWSDLKKDGSRNDFSFKVPFSDTGSVFLFNNGRYHSVINNSPDPRMHIIIHGPLRFTDEKLVKLARKQNQIKSHRELLEKLGQKKLLLGEDLSLDPDFYNEWKSLGYSVQSRTNRYSMAVLSHQLEPAIEEKVTDKLTLASLFPEPYKKIKFEDVHDFMEKSLLEGQEFVVLVHQGTYIRDLRRFTIELNKAFAEMVEDKASVCAHIMDFQKKGWVPYLHEQFVIVDLKKWNKIGKVSLGALFNNSPITFPQHEKPKTCLHDDYTPLWLAPGGMVEERKGEMNWGTEFMKKSLECGYKILNVPAGLREQKDYAYPLQSLDERYERIKQEVEQKLEVFSDIVFYFNNEKLDFLELANFEPKMFVSVCAGMKPLKMKDLFWGEKKPERSLLIDFCTPARDYYKRLLRCKSITEIAQLIQDHSKKHSGEKYSFDQALSMIESVIRDSFNNDETRFLSSLKGLEKADVLPMDLVNDREKFVEKFHKDFPAIIWLSNSFYCNPLYFLMTKKEADEAFIDLGRGLAHRYESKLWKHKSSYSMLIGRDPNKKIDVIITDGCVFEKSFHSSNWIQVD